MTCESCGAELSDGARFCTACGTPTSAPAATPTTGAAPAAPSEPAGVTQSWTPPPGPGGTPPPAAPPGAAWGTPPQEPPPGGQGRSRTGLVVGLLAGGVVLLGVLVIGFFVVRAFFGGDGGGADSPEAAVVDLATAVADEDAIGVVNAMNPDEVEPLVGVYQDLAARSEELQLLDLDDDGAPLGLELEVDRLDLEVEELGDGLARVTVRDGEVSALLAAADDEITGMVEGAEVPILDLGVDEDGLPDDLEGEVTADDVGDDLLGGEDPFLMVVEVDGGWYVSPSYTVAEGIAVANGWDDPQYDTDDDAPGAETPEAAVEAMAQAIEGFDLEDGAAVLPPDEARWAQDYVSSLLDAYGDDLEDEVESLDPELESLDLRVEEEGDGEAYVVVEQVVYSYDDEFDGRTTVEVDGDCVRVEDDLDDGERECLDDALVDDEADPALAELVPDEQGVVVVERDGGWFVSPVRTVARYVGNALDNVTERHVAALGLVPPEAIELGERVEAETVSGYTADSYAFDAEADVVYVVTGAAGDDEDDELAISRQVVRTFDDESVSFTAGAAGEEERTDDGFAYEVVVEEADVEGALVPGDEVEGSFDGAEYVLFELDTSGADEVEVQPGGDVAGGAVYDDLAYAGGLSPLAVFDDDGEGSSLFTTEEDQYLLLLADDPDGDYELALAGEGDDDVPGAEAFDGPVDVTFEGTISEDEPTQVFELDGDGSCYDVTVADADLDLDPFVTVLDPDGEVVETDDDGADTELDSFVSFCTESGQTGWQVEVSGFGDTTGPFVAFVDEL